ncbi:hypothetical protein CPC16_005473, partial [Podila verticillata]
VEGASSQHVSEMSAVQYGKEGIDWSYVAQKRLKQWTYAAWATQIHIDVYDIVAENSTI